MNHITDNFINIAATKNSTVQTIIDRINCSTTSIVGRAIEIVGEVANRTCYVHVESPNSIINYV